VGAGLHAPPGARVIIRSMRPRAPHRSRRALGAAGLTAAALAFGPAAVARDPAPPDAPVIARDAVDTAGGLDLTRVQLERAEDGRLRAALTLAAPWRMRDLPAESGPPGSLCLRMWTRADPPNAPPDVLLCITADARAQHMRGSLLVERDGELRRVAGARLARSSERTVVARFSQTAVGRPARIRFAAEATAPGCARPVCVDTAPNAPATATLTLRSG
jgi:hypothetical protein